MRSNSARAKFRKDPKKIKTKKYNKLKADSKKLLMRDRKVLCRFCENLRYTQTHRHSSTHTHALVHTHRVIKQKPTESIYREWAWVNYEAHLFKDWLPGDIFTPNSSDSHAPEMKMYLATHMCILQYVYLVDMPWMCVAIWQVFSEEKPAPCAASVSFLLVFPRSLNLFLSLYHSLPHSLSLSTTPSVCLSLSLFLYVNYILYIHRNEHTQCANKKRRAAQNVFYTD